MEQDIMQCNLVGDSPLARKFGFLVSGCLTAHKHVEYVEPDPDEASRCTDTIAVLGDNECRVNRYTREIFNKRGRELWYVATSVGDAEMDVRRWKAFLHGMHVI